MGQNCCGNSIYYAVYRNPDFLGCYEPPIPGPKLPGIATYPVACFSTPYAQTNPTSRNTAFSYNPQYQTILHPFTMTNIPGSYPWATTAYPQYNYLGCYSNDTQAGQVYYSFAGIGNEGPGIPSGTANITFCFQQCAKQNGGLGSTYVGFQGFVPQPANSMGSFLTAGGFYGM